ncbi:MAG: hypothetical protein WC881_11875 [Elusimicrobiota bacterium]|jgi:hypothetical protein
MEYWRDAMIFSGPLWEFILALALGGLGIILIRCGVGVCWHRFSRKPRSGPPDTPKDW